MSVEAVVRCACFIAGFLIAGAVQHVIWGRRLRELKLDRTEGLFAPFNVTAVGLNRCVCEHYCDDHWNMSGACGRMTSAGKVCACVRFVERPT